MHAHVTTCMFRVALNRAVNVPSISPLEGAAAVWRTGRQAKMFLEKKGKEKEAGEEREGDNNEDVDAEDGDGYRDGDGDGGNQMDGPRAGEDAPGANQDECMEVEVAGTEGDWSVAGEGEGRG